MKAGRNFYMKCALHNLGCKVNSYETEAMKQLLVKAGYEIVEFGREPADIYIINTCTVTNIADRKSRQMLHKAKKENPNAVVAAAGCYVQEAGEQLLKDSCVDLIVGNNKKGSIVELLEEYFAKNGKNVYRAEASKEDISGFIDINSTKEYERLEISESTAHTRAYIKIQDGCNQFCTYCIIPFARGRVRSRELKDILSEVHKLADSGCHEVVVTGIHLSSYGLDFEDREYNSRPEQNGERLLQVIEAIAGIGGIERIRLGSLEPRIITPEFVRRLAAVEKICPHFHLSLQSGCDATLRRMNRRYDTGEFYRGVRLLREVFDRPAVTTDVIVGFPGETGEEFEVTKEYLEKVGFFEMHVFKYSRRKGTMADRMPDQVPDAVKNQRSSILIELDKKLSEKYRESFIGREEEVLIEEYVTVEGQRLAAGHTKRYVSVLVEPPEEEVLRQIREVQPDYLAENTLVRVRITGLSGNDKVISQVLLANF